MNSRSLHLLLIVAVLTLCSQITVASTIISPVSVSTDMGTDNAIFALDNVLNQSGLSATYTSGVTDLSTFAAATTHTNSFNANNNIWLSSSSSATGYVDFDLGESQFIDAFVLWNYNNTSAIDEFRLTTGGSTVLGTFNATRTPLDNQISAQVFSFTPTAAEAVRMEVLSNHGSAWTAISEAAFGRAIVPEPSTALLLSFGLVGLAVQRRRRAL